MIQQAFVDQIVKEGVMSRTHQIIQRTSESSLPIADRLMDAEGDHEKSTVQRQAVRRFVITMSFYRSFTI